MESVPRKAVPPVVLSFVVSHSGSHTVFDVGKLNHSSVEHNLVVGDGLGPQGLTLVPVADHTGLGRWNHLVLGASERGNVGE